MGKIGDFTPEQDGSDALYEIVQTPWTPEETDERQDENGRICGVIQMGLSEVVNADAEGFLDELNERLTETMLSDISYEIVGFDNGHVEGVGRINLLHIEVSGEVFVGADDNDDDEDDDEEPENVPCQKCGRTDLPLHTNYQCPECHTPVTRVISLDEMKRLLKEYAYHYGDVSYMEDTNERDQIILTEESNEAIRLKIGVPCIQVWAYKSPQG